MTKKIKKECLVEKPKTNLKAYKQFRSAHKVFARYLNTG